jgi:hypothetical protein
LFSQLPAPAGIAIDGQRRLLALDGRCMERLALPVAAQVCRRSSERLDILITNPPKAATFLLGGLLLELEKHGIDYRLTSMEGNLEEELVRYVHRFRHVSVILLDCLENWDGERGSTLDCLRTEGYRVITLLDHREGAYSRTAILESTHEVTV